MAKSSIFSYHEHNLYLTNLTLGLVSLKPVLGSKGFVRLTEEATHHFSEVL